MSARRPKKRRRIKIVTLRDRKDPRIADDLLVPVRNHRVRNLFVRRTDDRLVVVQNGLVPVRPGVFGEIHVFWPEGGYDVGRLIQVRDWPEDSKYSTVKP